MAVAEKVKDLVRQKDKCRYCIITLLCVLLLTKVCANLAYGSAAPYQTYKDYYYYSAVAVFLAVLILIRRVSFLNAPILATVAVYTIASVKYFIAAAYEVELRNAVLAKCVAWGLFLIILADVVRTGKRTCFNQQNKVFSRITLTAFSLALAMGFQLSLCIFCPFAAFYLTPISKKEWNWLVDCFTVAYYGVFVWVMTKSLITIPPYSVPTGEWYYFGIWQDAWSGGIFCAGAFACVVYWLLKFRTADKKKSVQALACILAAIYPVCTAFLIASRAAGLGILGCVLFVWIFWMKPEKWKKRGIGAMAAIAAVTVCAVLFLRLLLNIDTDPIAVSKGVFGNHFLRLTAYAKRIFTGEGAYSIFPQGSVLAAIDELSSNRLCILAETIKNISFFGSGQLSVLVGERYFHPHNTYAAWLLMYGWAGGIPMIIWFFSFLVKSVGGVLKREAIWLFPFLWGALMAFAMLPDFLPWLYPGAFILFFVQYPLLIEQADEGSLFPGFRS